MTRFHQMALNGVRDAQINCFGIGKWFLNFEVLRSSLERKI